MNPIVSETDSAVKEPTATTKATPVRARRAPKNDTPRRKQATKNGGSPTPSRRRVRVAEGIYKDRHGLAATVKVNGVQREIRFPPGTPLKTIRARRDVLRASLRTLPAGARHTVAHDAGRYLQQVSGELVSIADRQYHLGLWTARFGHLRTPGAPAAHRRPQPSAAPVARDTVGLGLQPSAGRADESGESPVRAPRRGRAGRSRPLHAPAAAAAVARPHPHRGRAGAADARLHDRSTLTADALDGHAAVADGTLAAGRRPPRRADAVRRRAARQGGRLAAIPLVGDGLDAARAFVAIGAYGRWSCASANKALRGAARRAGRPAFTVYQIRHAFATGLRRTGSDVADIQDLYGHTDPETTMIYAPPQLLKHVAAIARLQRADRHRRQFRRGFGWQTRLAVR